MFVGVVLFGLKLKNIYTQQKMKKEKVFWRSEVRIIPLSYNVGKYNIKVCRRKMEIWLKFCFCSPFCVFSHFRIFSPNWFSFKLRTIWFKKIIIENFHWKENLVLNQMKWKEKKTPGQIEISFTVILNFWNKG